MNQYIVICLKDKTTENPATYTQTTRKRMNYDEAIHYAKAISPERLPLLVAVPWVETDENGYPILKDNT